MQITSSAKVLAHSTQVGSSIVSGIMSLMNLSTDYYFDSMFTDSVSTCNIFVESDRYSSLGSKLLCGDWMSKTSHDVSMRRIFPRYISTSLIVVYSSRTVVGPNGSFSKRRDSFSTIAMHFGAIFEFAWTHLYAPSRSVFPIKMHFDGHLSCMDAVMCRNTSSHNRYKHVCRVSLSTLLFTDIPNGSRK